MKTTEALYGDVYFVRHGDYLTPPYGSPANTPVLTAAGRQQIQGSAVMLQSVIEKQPRLLTSTEKRAVESAEIIARVMGIVPSSIGHSELMAVAGNDHRVVSDIRRLIRASVLEAGMDWDQDTEALIVVAHQPLVTSVEYDGADSDSRRGVAHGHVAQADLEAWVPHAYRAYDGLIPDYEAMLERAET